MVVFLYHQQCSFNWIFLLLMLSTTLFRMSHLLWAFFHQRFLLNLLDSHVHKRFSRHLGKPWGFQTRLSQIVSPGFPSLLVDHHLRPSPAAALPPFPAHRRVEGLDMPDILHFRHPLLLPWPSNEAGGLSCLKPQGLSHSKVTVTLPSSPNPLPSGE